MAQDIRIDAIIRRNLAMRRLPLHYYSPMLVMAKRGLEEMHFDTLNKLKTVVLDVDPTLFTADIPEDCVEVISVGLEVGDKVRTIGYDQKLNTRDDAGTAFSKESDLYTTGSAYLYTADMVENFYNEYMGAVGRQFGRPVTFTDSYTVLRDLGKIRLNNKSDATKILVYYLSMPEKITNKSVIHPFAQAALHSWINWQWAIYNKERDQELRRRDFYNDYRILRGRMNKMTVTEIRRVVRNNFHLAIKN